MRLLRCDDTQIFGFKAFAKEDEVPPYAILSHTWQEGEVTYDEMIKGSNKDKAGYDKIRFCAQQGKRDGLEYFWVDTCCINKADQIELRDALSSMFRWYQNAARCYVFLSDVSIGEQKADSDLLKFASTAAFRASRWFKRGWTLQELLAPASVDFFSKEWRRLGDKASLQRYICEATRIPDAALQGAPLSQFSVNERLKWSEHRETKLAEDRAYCLMGIFGVYISPFEGEGAGGAFRRLMDEIDKLSKCLQDVRLTDPRDDKKRIEDTKGGLLEGSYCWILHNASFQQWHNDPQSRLLWIKGDPGKGKTMLLCGVINELQKSIAKSSLLCYFFCQATDSRINSGVAVLRGLLYLLVSQQPSLASHVRKRYDHAGKSLFEDVNAWVVLAEIFTDVLRDPSLNTAYLIIDALDECVTDLPRLLEFVAKQSSASSRVKWIVSSRNWPNIEEQLERAGHKVRLSLELNAESVSAAVGDFIKQKVSQLAQQKQYDEQIQNAVLEHLTSNANNTFLWVALVCQDLQATARRNVLKRLNLFPPGLDSLYGQMMQQISKSDDAELCKQVLALIALVYRPVVLEELVALVEQLEDIANDLELREIISLCGSFLTLREGTIYFIHQSAKDFLLARAAKEVFISGREDVHYTIFTRSLKILYWTLQRDMYGLEALGYPAEDVKPPEPDPLAASRYSCVYWVDHLCDSNPLSSASLPVDLQDGGSVDKFLRQKYLYWLEAVSLCKTMSKGVVSMAKLKTLIHGRAHTSAVLELVQDACRFIMYHKGAIENAPLQTYVSALAFSPSGSLIRNLFKEEEPNWLTIKPPMRDKWNTCLQTLEDHSDSVLSVAFSHNSTWLASASQDKTVKIWDAGSGACLQTLYGHSNSVVSVAFSHDSTWLASASHDGTIKIWDASSGACLQTLAGHSYSVSSVAFSHDSTMLASASHDKTAKIWDASNGACLQTLNGHSSWVSSIAFSHDSTKLASASGDYTIKIWDTSNSKCLQTLNSHSHWITSVAFSHDSTLLASASVDRTVKIWDTSSNTCLQTLDGHNHRINSVVFSHNSTRLASVSHDYTVKIWDASSGACLQTLHGHSDSVWSVAFSHDSTRLASASNDGTVKIWDASSGACLQILDGHSDSVWSVAFSHDLTRLASASHDKTAKIWDANSGECLQTLGGHSDRASPVAFSHNSTQLASASRDETIRIWDTSSGACLHTLNGHSDYVSSVAFSHNSTLLASASHDMTLKIWGTSSGACLQTLHGHSDLVWSVTFSHDSTQLASASRDGTIRIWDASSGACLQKFDAHSHLVFSVAFSHDSTLLASASALGWYDRAVNNVTPTVKIWDASSGECLQTFHTGKPFHYISFEPTSSYLQTDIGTLVINASDGPLTLTDPQYQGAGISSDGLWITYHSKNVLWLPSEYRPLCSTVSGNKIGIGVRSGKVWMCDLELQ